MTQQNIPVELYGLVSSDFPETIKSFRELFRMLSEKNQAFMMLLHAPEEYLQEIIRSQLLVQISGLVNGNEWRNWGPVDQQPMGNILAGIGYDFSESLGRQSFRIHEEIPNSKLLSISQAVYDDISWILWEQHHGPMGNNNTFLENRNGAPMLVRYGGSRHHEWLSSHVHTPEKATIFRL